MGKKIAIMQPYFFPYIGYFQLINFVDEFILYDNIKYTKKGWINRNRILVNGIDEYITLPLKKDSDYLDVKDRYLSKEWILFRKKILNQIKETYRKALYFDEIIPIVEKIIMFEDSNLFHFILNSLQELNTFLEIKNNIVISSTIPIDTSLKAEKKIIALCKARCASKYINPIGGKELYSKEEFNKHGLDLNFLKSKNIIYSQFNNDFIPFLSIIDVLMFNSKDTVKDYLHSGFKIL